MSITAGVRREIEQIVDERIARAGAGREDSADLKASVRELVEIQKETNTTLGSLADAQERTEATLRSLADTQERTEAKLGTLADAQERTEVAMQGLARAVTDVRQELGGLSRTMGYGLENEAYRSLPGLLRARFGIEVRDRFVRVELGGEEINLLAHGERSGSPVLIVGETKLRLGERPYRPDLAGEVLDQLDRKAAAAGAAFPGVPVMKLLLTHFAPSGFRTGAEARGVLVVQSFEW